MKRIIGDHMTSVGSLQDVLKGIHQDSNEWGYKWTCLQYEGDAEAWRYNEIHCIKGWERWIKRMEVSMASYHSEIQGFQERNQHLIALSRKLGQMGEKCFALGQQWMVVYSMYALDYEEKKATYRKMVRLGMYHPDIGALLPILSQNQHIDLPTIRALVRKGVY